MPKDDAVVAYKEYPPFQLYRHGAPVGRFESPIEALEKIGNRKLLEQYLTLISADPGNLDNR